MRRGQATNLDSPEELHTTPTILCINVFLTFSDARRQPRLPLQILSKFRRYELCSGDQAFYFLPNSMIGNGHRTLSSV
jgi:hypothetical protein